MYKFFKDISDSFNNICWIVEFIIWDKFFKKKIFDWYLKQLFFFNKQFDYFCEKYINYFYNGNFLVFCSDYLFFIIFSFLTFVFFAIIYINNIVIFLDYIFYGDKSSLLNLLIKYIYKFFFK